MHIEKNSEIDEKTYIEYIRGLYSEKLDSFGEYKRLKNDFKKLSENKIALGIWPFIFCELWFIKRRMHYFGFTMIISYFLFYILMRYWYGGFRLHNTNLIYFLHLLYFFERLACAFFAKKLHYNFLMKKKNLIKKGPAWGYVYAAITLIFIILMIEWIILLIYYFIKYHVLCYF